MLRLPGIQNMRKQKGKEVMGYYKKMMNGWIEDNKGELEVEFVETKHMDDFKEWSMDNYDEIDIDHSEVYIETFYEDEFYVWCGAQYHEKLNGQADLALDISRGK